MIRFLILISLFCFSQIWHGKDSRTEVTELHGKNRALAQASVTLIEKSGVVPLMSGNFRIKTGTLEQVHEFCPGQRFAQNKVAIGAYCSGSLVAPNIVLTAAHCIETQEQCEDTVFVFGITDKSIDGILSKDLKYNCKKLLKSEWDYSKGKDIALIELDRSVIGITPLKWREQGSLKTGDEIYTVGAPQGLPLKRAEGKTLYVDKRGTRGISATIDTFPGNSGGPAINKSTGRLEGVVVTAERPVTWDEEEGCKTWASPIRLLRNHHGYWAARVGVVPVSHFKTDLEKYTDPTKLIRDELYFRNFDRLSPSSTR